VGIGRDIRHAGLTDHGRTAFAGRRKSIWTGFQGLFAASDRHNAQDTS